MSFFGYSDAKPKNTPIWFDRDLMRHAYASTGFRRPWTGMLGTMAKDFNCANAGQCPFSFLTIDTNGVSGLVHPKAIPVLLTTRSELRTRPKGPTEEAPVL